MEMITDIYGLGAPAEEQLYGIEIEVENVRRPPVWHTAIDRDGLVQWRTHEDGSLRGGLEFVTPPSTFNNAAKLLDQFYRAAAVEGYASSIRTGIHVHCDMRGRTIVEVGAIAAVYSVVEPYLFDLCGPEREECIYCVPWYRSRDDAAHLGEAIRHMRAGKRGAFADAIANTCKYAALYLEPLRRLGTIEFRAAPTFEELSDMIRWLRAVARVVRLGDFMETPERVAKYAGTAHGILRMVRYVLGPGTYDVSRTEKVDVTRTLTYLAHARQEGWTFQFSEPLAMSGIYHQTAGRMPQREVRIRPLDFNVVVDEVEPSDDDEEGEF